MPTIEDILSDISAEIAQLSGDVTSIGNASTINAGLVKVANQVAPEDSSVPTVAFLKNRNIIGENGEARGGLPQAQLEQVAALPAIEILDALASLPTNLSGLSGRIIAVNATGDGYEIIVAPSGGGSLADGEVITVKIANKAITLAKMADGTPGKYLKYNNITGAIEETDVVANIADNSISTNKLLNKNVTLEKMADGTPGKILRYNSTTGVIEETDIATLTSGMAHILRQTIPGSISQLDIEDASLFNGTYKQLMIIGSGIRPVTQSNGAGHFLCRVKTGGGYQTADYNSSGHDAPNNGGHNVYSENSAILLVPMWSSNYHWTDFTTTITNPASTGLPRSVFLTFGSETNDGNQSGNSTAAGSYRFTNTLPLQGLRFYYNSDNMLAGTIDIYGLK
ncbi:MAG: hypothetical protein K0R98_754 [Rickettsiaceae bacterium]|nr:hypothetical protein [Rickettsiaceae bacterium]